MKNLLGVCRCRHHQPAVVGLGLGCTAVHDSSRTERHCFFAVGGQPVGRAGGGGGEMGLATGIISLLWVGPALLYMTAAGQVTGQGCWAKGMSFPLGDWGGKGG